MQIHDLAETACQEGERLKPGSTVKREFKRWACLSLTAFVCSLIVSGCSLFPGIFKDPQQTQESEAAPVKDQPFASVEEIEIPDFTGEPVYVVNDGIPFFTDEDKCAEAKIEYSELDELGRCGPAVALVSLDTLPKEDRGLIGYVRPSGWHTVKYEGIDGNYLYNRCHLIAYCLAGDNADERNLITGTRYLNIESMLPIELEVLDHVVKNRDHVWYRATPVFKDNELVARGVLIEAYSVEDNGESLSLCVFCYNAQPGIEIDYATGESEQVEVIYMSSAS